MQDIEALFKQLPLTLDLSEIYDLSEVGRTQYRLRCMVCFYGQHYVLLAYKPRVRQWVQYDDTSVKAIGDWTEVEKRCKAGRFQYATYASLCFLPFSLPRASEQQSRSVSGAETYFDLRH